MRAEEYLTTLTEQIRCKRARSGVMREIRQHMEDQQSCFEDEGMDTAAAEAMTVKEMGSPVEAGIELDRIHRPRMAWGMIGLICLISVAGFMVQYVLQVSYKNAMFFPYSASRYILHLGMGFVAMAATCYFDYSQISRQAKVISVVFFILLIVTVPLFGVSYNGQRAWIGLGGIRLDVRQVLFLYVPLYGAILYSYRGQGYGVLAKAAAWALVPVAIALSCPSVTTAVMLAAAFVVVFSMAVWKGWYSIARIKTLILIWSGVLFLPVFSGLYILRFGADYQADRLLVITGFSDPMGLEAGYMLTTTRAVVAGSRLIGSSQIAIDQVLPGSNDHVLTYVISHFGILAAVVLVAVMGVLLYCMLRASLKQKNQLGMLMGVGCTAALTVQMGLYILGNTGVLLVFNYCPFLNYGGSGMVITYALLGLLLSICRYENVISESTLREDGKSGWRIRLVVEKDKGELRT